ncbi:MAG TPA: sigma 54-interacting transcriptional regulator [Vicinamibacterales bacterium]|nr:sigma 54-interacting transcriptional regulator [Vicinamibacterales bacterium]
MRRATRLEPAADDPFPEIDGASTEIRTLKQHMLSVARDPEVTVLILGESGTGKERVARAIHRVSPRSHAPFVVVDCASLSATLVEDELFGHVRGAFTGAIRDQPGPFERARGGTVLLDEVGDLTPDLQMKLLRALQARTVQRLGGGSETTFDVRVIASTNVDLAVARARGRFREDLYYRLNVYGVTVPPLRRRGARDVRALAKAILSRLAVRRRRPVPTIAPEVLQLLIRYQWPGNVRELENVLERIMVAAGLAPRLTPCHLPSDFGAPGPHTPADRGRRAPPAAAVEIISALEKNSFRSGRTAADLGLSRHQLYRLRKRYGVRGPSARG